MYTLIILVHIVLAAAIIGLVLLQQGRGAETGAAFGSGASSTMFGAPGTGNVLSHATAVLVGLFFVTSMALAIYARQNLEATSGSGLQEFAEELEGQQAPPGELSAEAEPAVTEQGADELDVPDFPEP